MSQVIVYKQDSGRVAVVFPTQEALERYGIDAIARKDVPAGKRYKILNFEDLPNQYPQDTWEVNEADLDDGVGSESNEFEGV